MTQDQPLRTLIVDDVADLRLTYRWLLEATGQFEIVGEAENGLRATELAAELQPDLILLDVSMPVQDGLEALPNILAGSPASKVVVLSGFADDRLGEAARERGAALYLEKGVSPQRMVDQLLEVAGGGRESRQVPSSSTVEHPVEEARDGEELLAFVAHELRNPLASIMGFASTLEILLSELSEDHLSVIARRITSNARYLDGVIRSMLMLRAIEAGDLLLETSLQDATQLLEEALPDIESGTDGHRIDLKIEGPLPPVSVDRERLRQVLTNLVGNAARYSPKGSPITVEVRPDEGEIVVGVLDSGPGIPKQHREKVFEKFARLEGKGAGLGLGLFISRVLIEAMGGRIWVGESHTGTRMCFTLVARYEDDAS